MQTYTNKLTPDLLRHLKTLALNSRVQVDQILSNSLLQIATVDLKQEVIKSIRMEIANVLAKKSRIITGPSDYDNYGARYRGISWCFNDEELDNFIADIYTAGLNAKDIV